MNTSKSLDLAELLMSVFDSGLEAGQDIVLNRQFDADVEYYGRYRERKIKPAWSAIVEAVEGLIGEDEPEDDEFLTLSEGRNSLRDELRQAIKEWQ